MDSDTESLSSLKSRKKTIAAAVAVVVVVAVSAFALTEMDFDNEEMSEEEQPAEEESETTSFVTAEEIEGDITEVTLNDQSADPHRPEISPEDGVRFVNEEEFEVQLDFDRDGYDTVTLNSGDSGIMDIRHIIYYEITPVDDEVEYRTPGGTGINVQ